MVKGTRENIINSFFKLASKYPERTNFSIAEIAEEAQLSRQAIYRNHFNSSEEIIHYLHDTIDSEVLDVFKKYDKENPIFFFADEVIPIIYKRRTWLRLLYSTAVDPNWNAFIKQRYIKWVMGNISLKSYGNLDWSKESIAQYIVDSTMTIVEIWLSKDIPDHPQKFAKVFLKLVNYSLSDFIE